MKTGGQPFRWLVLGIAAAAAAVHAAEGEIVTLGEQGWREQTPALSVASGGTLSVSVLVPVALSASDFSIEFWQVAGGTMIPLQKGLSFAEAVVDGSPNAQGVTVLRLTLPEVKRKTRVLVKFITVREPQADAGRAQVWVYPPINWEPLARKFKNGTPNLVLFGETAGLREYFEARDIVFSDHGAEPPENLESGTLVLGAFTSEEWGERKDRLMNDGGRLIVFVPDAPGLPGVYTTASGAGAVTRVTLPVLENLVRDPRAEELFFQLIEQHLHTTPAALP